MLIAFRVIIENRSDLSEDDAIFMAWRSASLGKRFGQNDDEYLFFFDGGNGYRVSARPNKKSWRFVGGWS